MTEPLVPSQGWGVLHLFHKVDHERAATASPGDVKALVDALEQVADATQLHLFSVLGHKADTMTMLLEPDVARLRAFQTTIDAAAAPCGVTLDWSYLSITEGSEYSPTPEQYRQDMAPKVEEPERLDRMVEEFRDRMAKYNENKIHPAMPAWELMCFYPMSHRREGDDNWYSLDFDRRRELMGEHGKSGRAYTGRVLQLVTGSTGLDDWEWGVTLFAHDMYDLKDIVYRLRYDEASARFAEFGPFLIGIRRSPAELVAELGLPSAT